MRRALQYSAVAARTLAVHCEEATLTRGGHAHAGLVATELGLGGWPSLGESLMVSRDLDLAGDAERPVHLMHLSAASRSTTFGGRSTRASGGPAR